MGLAFLLACAVLLPLLGHRVLTDWDEGIYAEIAREMIEGGTWHSWLVPHFNGQLWFEKPPLQLWLTACSLRVFGLTAFAARLPSALAGVFSVAVLHAWLFRRFDRLAAWLGTALLLSAFGFQHAARTGETDSLLSLFCLLATLGLAETLLGRKRGWLLFGAGFGLALLTKGAASVTLPLTAILLALVERHDLLRFRRSFIGGSLLFALLAAPWHILVYTRFRDRFVHEYLGFHVLQRATLAIEGHQTHPWFYVWVLLISAPPFALLYPLAVARPFQKFTLDPVEVPQQRALRALALFALVELCFFSAVRTRLPHYIAPIYAPLSALTAVYAAAWLRSLGIPAPKLLSRVAAAILAVWALAAVSTAGARRALHSPYLPDGRRSPDNREAAMLLQSALRSHVELPGGPLLVWHNDPNTPIATEAFYSRRPAQPVALAAPLASAIPGRYAPEPQALVEAVQSPRLLLMDKNLRSLLPSGFVVNRVADGATQRVAVIRRADPRH